MPTPEELEEIHADIAHMKGYHGCPDCFDPDLSMPGLGERMKEMHAGYHSEEGPSANFGGEMVPHWHEGLFNDRRKKK